MTIFQDNIYTYYLEKKPATLKNQVDTTLYIIHKFPAIFSNRETQRTKDLLHQFRLWKLLKRKHWNVVVTERAKKEMADRDDSGL